MPSAATDETVIYHSHDRVLRAAFGYHAIASEVPKVVGDPDFVANADLDHPVLLPDRFDRDDLTNRITDMCIEVQMKNGPAAMLVVIENQSTVETDMLLRVWDLIGRIWSKLLKDKRWKDGLPIVRPMIISNADKPWSGPIDTDEWLAGVRHLEGNAYDTRLRLKCDLLDLYGKPTSYFEQLPVSAATRSLLFSMAFAKSPDLVAKVEAFRNVLAETIRGNDGVALVKLLTNYLQVRSPNMTERAMYNICGMA